MELWDALLADGAPAGRDLTRGLPMPPGLYHAVAEVVVVHEDGSHLITQRDAAKRKFPLLWEAGAGGCVLKGETPVEGARRELFEETGLSADTLTPLYTLSDPHSRSIFYGFLYQTKTEKTAVTLQTGETCDYRWLARDEFLAFTDSPSFVPSTRDRLRPYLDTI